MQNYSAETWQEILLQLIFDLTAMKDTLNYRGPIFKEGILELKLFSTKNAYPICFLHFCPEQPNFWSTQKLREKLTILQDVLCQSSYKRYLGCPNSCLV